MRRRPALSRDRVAEDGAPVTDHLSDLFDDIRCESISFFSARYAAPWQLQFPGRDETCGYLLEEGSAVLETGGACWELEAGDLALVLQGNPHSLSNLANATSASVGHAIYRLDRTRAAPLLKLLPPVVILKGEGSRMSRWVQPLASLILELRETHDPGGPAIMRRLAEAALIRAAQDYLLRQLSVDRAMLKADFYRIAPVLRAMHRRPGMRWSVTSLARAAGMSRTIFATVFAQTMGETPGHYLTMIRMSAARELLRSGRLSTAEVATRVGYRTEVAFGRAFKRLCGMSPGEFRRSGASV